LGGWKIEKIKVERKCFFGCLVERRKGSEFWWGLSVFPLAHQK